ncbi:hypothetical protein FEM48_Zijuj04G0076900 [Ziziphus jujuba var. spinosa]|uniref:Uncharacterized protein n=1 Tax=Ziziphus jujuba var. spinosa TaxID=714518 RepID=A0A978VIM3_ZIZJJ|nr:hypothetical protein FEM48_Zijuj04G0076900 [Ziziphus jujuba var. spinosa]
MLARPLPMDASVLILMTPREGWSHDVVATGVRVGGQLPRQAFFKSIHRAAPPSPTKRHTKISVIGASNVGMAIAQTILIQDLAEKLVLIHGKPDKLHRTVAAVEELKDKKLCTRNSCLSSSLHNQHVSGNVRCSKLSPQMVSSSSSSSSNMKSKKRSKQESLKQPEESLRMIMYLSCWGPN